MKQKRIEDYGINIGKMQKGKLNKITDVPGVTVGHATIDNDNHKTGVTMIMPTPKNIFNDKLVASSFVWNGFGKTAGLVQIDELGTIETPIAITNTLNVGLVHDAIVEYMIDICNKDNIKLRSINPIVCECNDSSLNNIQIRAVKKENVFEAIANATEDFIEGDIGGGKGTTCHSLKGGIGSASRIIELDNKKYTLGVLVQSNHGSLVDLVIDHKEIGLEINKEIESNTPDKGSIIMIIATDLPVSDRQLKRIIKRCSVGLARIGSYIGHGSGEIMVGFTTANTIRKDEEKGIISQNILNEDKIDLAFRACAEATEEAVLNSMITANAVDGYERRDESLQKYINKLL